MAANPIDTATFRRILKMHVDGVRPRRFSSDPARKRFYATSRARRYGKYLATLAK